MTFLRRGGFGRCRSEAPNTSGRGRSIRACRPRSLRAMSVPMSQVLDIAAVAALVGDPARANILCRAARRPRADRERTRLCGARHAADRERPSRQALQGEPDRAGAAGPPPLLQARRQACRRDDREHLGGHRCRAAAAETDPHRRRHAPGAHVLRPRGGPARRHARRCAVRASPHRIRRRRRRGHALGRGLLSRNSASTSRRRARATACSAARASTGASGARIWPARSAPRSQAA